MSETQKQQIETKPEIKKGFQYSPEIKKLITIIAVIALIVPFFIYGVASAYDAFVFNYLESNLITRVNEKKASIKNCDEAYQALLRYKQSSRIQIAGSGNPCNITSLKQGETQAAENVF